MGGFWLKIEGLILGVRLKGNPKQLIGIKRGL